MSASINLTETATVAILGQFLASIIPGAASSPITFEIVVGQQNRVPEPISADYVVMTPIMRMRLETTSNIYADGPYQVGNPSGTQTATAPTELTIQCDFHGPNSGDNAQIFTTLFRDEYATQFFTDAQVALSDIQASLGANMTDQTGAPIVVVASVDAAPLYTSDPRQVPFINGEEQYEERWSVDAAIQINAAVTVPLAFASYLGPVGLINVEATYH